MFAAKAVYSKRQMDTRVSFCISAVSGASTGFTIGRGVSERSKVYSVSVLPILGDGRFDIL